MEKSQVSKEDLDGFRELAVSNIRTMFSHVLKKDMKKLSKDLSKFVTPCLQDLELGYHWVSGSRGLMDIENGKQLVSFKNLIKRVQWGCQHSDVSTVKSACGTPGEKSYLGVEIKHKNYYVDQNWNWVQIKGFFEDLLIAGVITYMRSKVVEDQPIVMSEFVKHVNKPLDEINKVLFDFAN